ncbi:MAG: transcriptional repressor [Candidatus Aminicenantes bacterium]|nr:transcriptional repressor [Candidatus Aminicenantes bacterium]
MDHKTTNPIAESLRQSGRRATQKRSLILDLLQKDPGHPDAGSLFLKARETDPKISLATVYRTLALLKKSGIIEEHRLGESHGHFEPVTKAAHVHFTCAACGRVIEFSHPLLDRLKAEMKRKMNVDLREFHITAGGLCSRCRKTGARP